MNGRDFQPHCGTYARGHSTVTGVMLVRAGIPNHRGQFWVGGTQRVLIQWSDGRTTAQSALYARVNRHVREAPDEQALMAALAADPKLTIRWKLP